MCLILLYYVGDPNGVRTRVAGVRGRSPRPLDDGALRWVLLVNDVFLFVKELLEARLISVGIMPDDKTCSCRPCLGKFLRIFDHIATFIRSVNQKVPGILQPHGIKTVLHGEDCAFKDPGAPGCSNRYKKTLPVWILDP